MGSSVVLFTRDLRIHDHPALHAAWSAGPVVPLFVLDPALLGASPNRDRFLLDALRDLDGSLERRGARLVLREGGSARVVREVVTEMGATAVHVTEDVSSVAVRRQDQLREALAGVAELHLHPGHFIVAAGEVAPEGRDHYAVFTPYHRAWQAAPRRAVLPAPERIELPDVALDPGARPDPSSVQPDAADLPPGGATAGRELVDAYVDGDLLEYDDVRNDLAAGRTSRISPYLRFGCVSANELAERAKKQPAFVRQLAWRDFYAQLLAHDPSYAWRDLRDGPDDVPEPPGDADELLAAWTEGRTGIPLVDAGMRQLDREGWMHNRARMIVASFLTRRLGIPWQRGAEVFMRLLVDGDPSNNAGGWQWAAGTGTDPRRSRSFNPVRQARRFDPDGGYIRRYVRELADIPAPLIAAPWIDPEVLAATGYPPPVVDLPADGIKPGATQLRLTDQSSGRSRPSSAPSSWASRTAKSR